MNRSGHGSAMGVYLGQIIDSRTPPTGSALSPEAAGRVSCLRTKIVEGTTPLCPTVTDAHRRTLEAMSVCAFVCGVQKYSEGPRGSSEYTLRAFNRFSGARFLKEPCVSAFSCLANLRILPRFLFSQLLRHIFPGDTFPPTTPARRAVGKDDHAQELVRKLVHQLCEEPRVILMFMNVHKEGPAWTSTPFPSKCRTRPYLP